MGGGFSSAGEAFIAPSGAFVAGGGLGFRGVDFISGVFIPIPPASVDLNFATGQYSGVVGLPTAFLTTVRAAPAAYAVDASGNWSSFAANVPRITNLGLLAEESRTNAIRNNTMVGVVSGSPGTLPTNWSEFNPFTRSVVGSGTENGINYVDVRITGSTASQYALYFDTNTGIPSGNGVTWCISFFVKIVAGSTANINSFFTAADQYSSAPANLGSIGGGAFTPFASANPLGQSRFQSSASFTTNNAAVASIQPYLSFLTAAAAFDITLRIGWPQIEEASFATSPIPTAGTAAVTRAADVISLATPLVYGNAYSFFAQGVPESPVNNTQNQFMVGADDGTANNRVGVFRGSTTAAGAMVITNAGVGTAGGAGLWDVSQVGKIAGSASTGANGNVAFNGSAAVGIAQAAPAGSVLSSTKIGGSVGGVFANGFISRVALWQNVALGTGQLQALTI